MTYEIFGGNLPAVAIRLEQGESIYTESGGMSWMTNDIEMQTNMKGGLMKGLGRMLSGESLFMATFTAAHPNQEITVASSFPGEILCLELSHGKEYICQKSAFLCAQSYVERSTEIVKGIAGGLFGGEGFIMQRLKGSGLAFLEIDGSLRKVTLQPGERLKVDTGNVAVFEASMSYTVQMVKGFKNVLFGGEGLFLTVLEGPGTAYLQTMTMPGFAGRIIPYLPKSSD
ncbi:MAG: TIGR00266 family protein [Acetanaerobacterium sp.]